jgi:hypothetical protein
MIRILVAILACLLAVPAEAGSTMWSGGVANWFYTCANDEPMNIYILHPDESLTQLSLARGQILRTPVRRGDLVSWRCDNRAVPLGEFRYIVTVP